MRTNNHKLKAFTILEMTVAMLIAAIVIGITYTAYAIVSKSYMNFKIRNENLAVLARLDHLIRRDFERSDRISGNTNVVWLDGYEGQSISYEFASNYIVRHAQSIDTFKVSNDHFQVAFEGKPQSNSENNTPQSDEANRIDELSFTVNFEKEVIPYHYQKKYSSTNLINRNPYAIN